MRRFAVPCIAYLAAAAVGQEAQGHNPNVVAIENMADLNYGPSNSRLGTCCLDCTGKWGANSPASAGKLGQGNAKQPKAQKRPPNIFDWLDRELFRRVRMTGSRQLAYHNHNVDGDEGAFNSLTYYGRGGDQFTDTGAVSFSGRKVLGLFNFDFTLTDNRFQDPQAQRIALNFDRGPVQVEAGDIQGSVLNTNAFASLNRNMKGATVAFRQGRFAAKVVRTDTKGSARTVSFGGANTAGPYYLQSSQVITGSEQVLVDGREMERQVDYSIDYEIGAITFVGRLIAPTSTITVTYEALDFNAGSGSLMGGGLSYDFGRAGRVGLTMMEQKARGSGALSSRIEQFQGFGAASTPYFLQFEPLNSVAFPTTVRVDGVLQVETVDYHFDALNKSIFYLHRFIPSTSIVEVIYFPKPTSLGEGDRRVVGFDYRLPIGRKGAITYSQATGSLDSITTPLSGTARGVTASYESGGLTLRGGVRNIPAEYVAIESRGFSRNDKAWNFNGDFKKMGITYSLNHQNASISSRSVDNLGAVSFSSARETVTRLGAQGKEWVAEHTRTGVQSRGTETKLDATSLSYSQTVGKMSARFGLENYLGRVDDGSPKNLSLQGLRFDATYKANKHWNLNWRAGINQTRYDGDEGTGRDLSFDARFQPRQDFSLTLGFADSRSGAISALSGFTGSLGAGFGGNGFSSGLIGAGPISSGSDLRQLQATARWQATPRINVDARAFMRRTVGSVTSNSETTAIGLGADFDLGKGHFFSMNLDNSKTRYIGLPLNSNALNLQTNLSGRIGEKWTYNLGAIGLLSGGGSFAQDVLNLDGSLSYRLDPRQILHARFSLGQTTGYLPQNEFYAGLFYEYQLFRNISLVGSYKFRNVANTDPFQTSGAYRSRGFDIELSFNFAG